MNLIFAPILRSRLWRKRNTDRLFYYDRSIYGNSVVMYEVKKVFPGIYRKVSPPWFTDFSVVEQFWERMPCEA